MRTVRPREPRVVYVGTHGTGAASTLWTRLQQHRGTSNGGNHRGAVLRKHVGAALIARDAAMDAVPRWGVGQSGENADRAAEMEYEIEASAHIRIMRIVWLDVPGKRGQNRDIDFIASNVVALLSNGLAPLDPPSAEWLGRHNPRQEIQLSGLWNVQHVMDSVDGSALDLMEELIHTR